MATPLRSYSVFKGFFFDRLDESRVRIFSLAKCTECDTYCVMHNLIVYEPNDASLVLSGLKAIGDSGLIPNEQGKVPYAGGPFLCPVHHEMWLEGKVLPSHDGVLA